MPIINPPRKSTILRYGPDGQAQFLTEQRGQLSLLDSLNVSEYSGVCLEDPSCFLVLSGTRSFLAFRAHQDYDGRVDQDFTY